MNQKDFNLLINDISIIVKELNQLLYECLVLIIFYYIFNKISFLNSNSKIHKPFVYLIFTICIGLDWFIWNNSNQTSLFIAILFIYIAYNFNVSNTISTFINSVNESKKNNRYNKHIENEIKFNLLDKDMQNAKILEDIDKITFIPKDFTPSINIKPYEKTMNGINEINVAYSSNEKPINVLGLDYADIKLRELRKTPQYQNEFLSSSDTIISNDLIENSINPNITKYNGYNDNSNNIDNIDNIDINAKLNKINTDLFRNPKRDFLDNKWLQIKDNTYNDVCTTCTTSNKGNAICTVPKYGEGLEECTNQTNSVNDTQLQQISNNKIEPIYKF
jgi:hypothetical protein